MMCIIRILMDEKHNVTVIFFEMLLCSSLCIFFERAEFSKFLTQLIFYLFHFSIFVIVFVVEKYGNVNIQYILFK